MPVTFPHLIGAIGACAVLGFGCGGSAKPLVPEPVEPVGWVAVRTVTSGEETPAGIEVAFGDERRVTSPNALVVFGAAKVGAHTVQLIVAQSFCQLNGPAQREVMVALNDTSYVTFELQCPTAGPDRLIVQIAGNLYSMTEYGTRIRALTSVVQNYYAAISPDGKKIAFTSNRDGNNEIYVMNSDGSNQQNLTRSPGTRDWWPNWSPDGTRIIFYSWNTAAGPYTGEIYVMDAAGGAWTPLTSNTALDADPQWSPDGKRIVFMSERDGQGNQEIYVMNADGTGAVRLTNDPGLDGTPRWSPDGSRIAFATTRFALPGTEAYDIAVMNPDGSGFQRLTDDPEIDVHPIWSPDGLRIVYNHRVQQGDIDVWIMKADGSEGRALLYGPGNHQAYDWGVIR